jgi:uncharacterized protein (DUF1800 family)
VAVSDRERIAHVVRRLSMGAHPDLVAHLDDTDAAIARALDRSGPAVQPLQLPVPTDVKSGNKVRDVLTMVDWWVQRMQQPDHLVEERMTWFWHDHFATSVQKVRVPYLVLQQHVMLRQHALGNFAELLESVARDPAMLIYLDGITNSATERNENFGRECLELFTMGRDNGYTQDDVVAASRAFTGWVVVLPNRPVLSRLGAPWSSVFIPRRHDQDTKTFLGTTAALDMKGALDVVLEQPQTARFIVAKLWRELVGLEPDDKTVDSLARDFRRDYEIAPLVETIARHDEFTSDAAVRSKYRSPVEKLVGIVQASGAPAAGGVARSRRSVRQAIGPARALRAMSYLPFLPPNVAGFPKGARLLGPSNLVHTFDLVQAVPGPPTTKSVDDLMARFGIHDVSDVTRRVLVAERDPARRFVLAAASPEYTLT